MTSSDCFRTPRIAAIPALFFVFLVSCAQDAPRAMLRGSPENVRLAARNFRAMSTVRIEVRSPDGRVITADVRLPDMMRVRGPDGEITVAGERVWQLTAEGPSSAQPGEDVLGLRDAIEIARTLDASGAVRFRGYGSVLGYSSTIWEVDDVRGGSIVLSLSDHDALPRLIAVTTPDGARSYLFKDYGAALGDPLVPDRHALRSGPSTGDIGTRRPS